MSELLSIEPGFLAPPPTALLDLDQSLLDALPLGVYACDADGRIVRVNAKAAALWGRAPRLFDMATLFCGCFRIETLDGRFIPPEQTPMAAAVLHGQAFDGVEAVVTNPDGRRWVARVHIEPLRDADGALIGAVNCFQDVTREHELLRALERQQRTFDLAMVASDMGTWRYTFADNTCVYDANAQRLYGLTEARFLHDEAGVAGKFHPDDMAPMWAGVARAMDPEGDGRYEVEYRVRQVDGSWRWLSAWGQLESDAAGRPVALAGASRDLTADKRAAEHQALMVNELNHRVKNSLATVQSVTVQTLRAAPSLAAAREALESRIVSLARAHDLLTDRSWSAADFNAVVTRAVEPFGLARFEIEGPVLDVSPRHVLMLSMALHELATNAAKYGALTSQSGRVSIGWVLDGATLTLTWTESGGPPVTPPTRRGFGARLLQDGLMREFSGRTRLDYALEGVTCEIAVGL